MLDRFAQREKLGIRPVWARLIESVAWRVAYRLGAGAFPGDVKASTSPAPISNKAITLTEISGCPLPELQGDTVTFRTPTVGVKRSAASGVGAWENPIGSWHDSVPLVTGQSRAAEAQLDVWAQLDMVKHRDWLGHDSTLMTKLEMRSDAHQAKIHQTVRASSGRSMISMEGWTESRLPILN